MTQRDYNLIATAIKQANAEVIDLGMDAIALREQGIVFTALHLADAISNDNPAFDRLQFFEACGVSA